MSKNLYRRSQIAQKLVREARELISGYDDYQKKTQNKKIKETNKHEKVNVDIFADMPSLEPLETCNVLVQVQTNVKRQ